MPLAPNSAMLFLPWNLLGGMPRIVLPGGKQVAQPHAEWYLHQLRWRWLLDSWEGGEAYRMAVYGFDIHAMPIRNMIRHKREYPSVQDQTYSIQTGRPPGTDPYNQATDDDYELRRARTPVPGFLAEVIERHLGKIYKKEVKRNGPDQIMEWWQDVDGRKTTIDQWMIETIAPLLLVLGQLDIVLDHPPVPVGEKVRSRADEVRLGLDNVVASYILPENVIWWQLDSKGRYEEVLIREVQDDQNVLWRYWNKEIWALYDKTGNMIESEFQPYDLDVNGRPKAPVPHMQDEAAMKGLPVEHGFGEVPIMRVFDRRRPRVRNVGLPRYEMIAEMQREYYNRDSELILSDTTQAHALLQGPEDYVTADGTIPVGPNWLLPKKKSISGGSTSYEGFEAVEFPKEGADSIRLNLDRLRDGVDRLAGLTKPAGAQGSTAQTVSQSGVSKQLDAETGHDLLGNISKTLQRIEQAIAELYWFVAGNGKLDEAAVEETQIQYPAEFALQSADDLADLTKKYQMLINGAGRSPQVEGKMLERLVKQSLGGLDDAEYESMNDEIQAIVGQGVQPEQEQLEGAGAVNYPNQRAMDQNLQLDQIQRNPDEMLG